MPRFPIITSLEFSKAYTQTYQVNEVEVEYAGWEYVENSTYWSVPLNDLYPALALLKPAELGVVPTWPPTVSFQPPPLPE